MSSPEATEKAWSTADNLRDLLTSSEQSLVETTSQNLFETPGSWFGAVREASDGVREADEEWVTVTPKYIADAQEGGRPMQAITRVRDAVDPNNPPAGAFQAKVVQVTPVESLAQVEKGPDGGMALTQPGQEGAGGAGDSSGAFVIPAGHTTRIDLSGPGQEVVLTESLTGCTIAWGYDDEKQALYMTHIMPASGFSGSQLFTALHSAGSVVFEGAPESVGPAQLFGTGPIQQGGHGAVGPGVIGEAKGFFMVTKTQQEDSSTSAEPSEPGIYITFQGIATNINKQENSWRPAPTYQQVLARVKDLWDMAFDHGSPVAGSGDPGISPPFSDNMVSTGVRVVKPPQQ